MTNINNDILTNYQQTYPNLRDFFYNEATDTIIYHGLTIKLNGYGLSRIDKIFFNLTPDDIFTYLKNGFYQNTEEADLMNSLLNQLIITEEEVAFIDSYLQKLADRLKIYEHNKDFIDSNLTNPSIKDFFDKIRNGSKVIEKINTGNFSNQNVADIFTQAYQKYFFTTGLENSQEKIQSLTRTNPNFRGYQEFSENEQYLQELKQRDKFGLAGYTSILLIIMTSITAGMYIALQFLK